MGLDEDVSASEPLRLVDTGEGLYLVGEGWMVRRPRGSDEGWLLDLSGGATRSDWHLFNVRAKDALQVVFETPQRALEALSGPLAAQVRPGQVWADDKTGERFLVTEVEHFGLGADGTVFVRSLDDPRKAFSPGDFRRHYTKLSEHE
jgi:hypothetical protein